MKRRYIFDLDGTLLLSDYKLEREYFQSVYGDKAEVFTSNMGETLNEYERIYPKYDVELLSDYLTVKTGVEVTPNIINGWIDVISSEQSEIVPGVIEALEYLKDKNFSLAVLTNWFGKTQKGRLEKTGLIGYFDDIYTGESILKPRRDAYISAKDRFYPSECVFIGDDVLKDYIGPRTCGMDSILYDSNNKYHKTLIKVRNMKDVIRKY